MCSTFKCSNNRLVFQEDECEAHHLLDISRNQGLKDEQYESAVAQWRWMADMAHPVIDQGILTGGGADD
jgi:hypothetical protein